MIDGSYLKIRLHWRKVDGNDSGVWILIGYLFVSFLTAQNSSSAAFTKIDSPDSSSRANIQDPLDLEAFLEWSGGQFTTVCHEMDVMLKIYHH